MWLTALECLTHWGEEKLVALTHEPSYASEVVLVSGTTYETPLVRASGWTVLDGGAEVTAYTVGDGTGTDGRDRITLTSPPVGTVTVKAESAINADVLDRALVQAQAEIRGPLDAALWAVPDDDAVGVHAVLKGWAFAIAGYLLARSSRRPGLLDRFPELRTGYEDLTGTQGRTGLLQRVQRGEHSLSGILSQREIDEDLDTQILYSSNDRVYTGRTGAL